MFCGRASHKVVHGGSNGQSQKANVPLLLHFDVNKTIIQSDSIQMKSIEEGVREGISELFWGNTRKESSGQAAGWEWSRTKPSCAPPTDDVCHVGETLTTYQQHCKEVIKGKAEAKEAVRTFKLVEGTPVRAEMDKLLQLTMKRMQIPADVKFTKEAEAAGIKGSSYNMFPTLFHLVANLQRGNRIFAVIFRSFGADHENIQMEWNAFCELRHPVFSRLIEDLGPMDGSIAGIPDRRIHGLHTLYRDAQGPVLILHTFTNGPPESTWDSWAKQRPKPKVDTRHGREFIDKTLKAKTVDGMAKLAKWMKDHLLSQGTTAIKDDWAWWQFCDEQAHGGKLLTIIPGKMQTQQVFFDDNIDHDDPRIVDIRDPNGQPLAPSKTMNKICIKVNPVEALLDDDYFFRKLLHSQGDHLDVGASLMGLQKQLTDIEEEKNLLQRQLNAMGLQLKNLTEENRRMKLQRRIQVRDEAELQNVLAKHVDLSKFDSEGHRGIAELYEEIEQGHCWLEVNEQSQVFRVLDMLFLKIIFKDMLLIESHEQDAAGRITTRNYLPGVRMTLKDSSMQMALDRFFEHGLQGVSLKKCIETDMMPVAAPEAPNQQTSATLAYPVPCIVQQSQGIFSIPEKEVELHKEMLAKIGLPGGKHFSTTEQDLQGGTITRFWRWDKVATFQAGNTQGARTVRNVNETCEKLFKGHPRAETYKKILLEMFDSFEAQKLCGGFSGSVVIRVQPFEADGRKGEPCIVKLDAGDAIEEEFQNSANVFEALPDRAARILGDAVYANDAKGERLGAMRLELAGACWNVPELAQGSANLLSTFKDLLLYEGEQVLAVGNAATGDVRPFGNVNSVLAETFGPGGVVSALRKGGKGLRRATDKPLVGTGWYTLKGKEGEFNPLTAKKGEYPPEPTMRKMYKEYFGGDFPDLKALIGVIKPKLENMAQKATKELYPLIGLAHGDLNAANIMIDALDAVWLIDFATSVDLPLFTDMCKFEMASLFEYAVIPITPKAMLDFASPNEAAWSKLNVGDWLRTDQKVVEDLLKKFVALGNERLASLGEKDLERLIEEVVSKSGKAPHKQRGMTRSLKARLCHDQSLMDAAFNYCASISNNLLRGDKLLQSLEVRSIPLPDGRGSRGALSLRYFMDLCVAIRRFMVSDISSVLREQAKHPQGLQPVDVLSLQLWLPFLRESYRILGYRDVAPQYKLWSMYHCKKVAEKVQSILDVIQKSTNLAATLELNKDKQNLEARKATSQRPNETIGLSHTLQALSRWVFANNAVLPQVEASTKVVRHLHQQCALCSQKPGLYAPIWEVHDMSGAIVSVEFMKDNAMRERSNGAGGAWTLTIGPEEDDDIGEGKRVHIGYMTPGKRREPQSILMNSRLLSLSVPILQEIRHEFSMRKKKEDSKSATANTFTAPIKNFRLEEWSTDGQTLSTMLQALSGTQPMDEHNKHPAFSKFHSVEALAVDPSGKESIKFTLEVGIPAFCYPTGTNLTVDISGEGHGQVNAPSVVVTGFNENGTYETVNFDKPDGERVAFDPSPLNHTFPDQAAYIDGQALLLKQASSEQGATRTVWADAAVEGLPSRDSGYRYKLKVNNPDGTVAQVSKYLSSMLSGRAFPSMTGGNFEDEIHKIKAFFRARHSYLVDALSGVRLNVKECAPPTLSFKPIEKIEGVDFSRSQSRMIARSSNSGSGGKKVASVQSIVSQGSQGGDVAGSSRFGWPAVLASLDTFEKGQPTCQPSAFLVLGSPGSGKSCMVNRVIMETLDRYVNLVPLLIPIADMVRRSGGETDLSNPTRELIYDWFDRYLRVTYGEDSNRYWMICQAMQMKRVAFLFEGLEDGGAFMRAVEGVIRNLILDGHLVIITSRPLLGGESSLEEMSEYLTVMQLENLSDENKRAVALKRLGHEGIGGYDELFNRLRESQAPADAQGENGEDDVREKENEQDVFGNPMMLSMLLCYLQTMQKQKKEVETLEEGGEESGGDATLTAVYRVALDVMLQRVQSRQMAERHNKEKKVELCKSILEKMSLTMQLQRRLGITATEVEKLLPKGKESEELHQVWEGLKAATQAGHAMFLRLSQDGGKTELKFLVKGFQNFFAAQAIVNGSDKDMPSLQELLTDPWWAQMLEMLAEARPLRYVEVIESRLKSAPQGPELGDSFLHIAARAGHRPVFQLLKLMSESNRKALFKRSKDMRTPLHVAAEKGNTALCKLMLEANASIDAEDSNERLAMHVAMQHGYFPTAKVLMQKWNEQFGGKDTTYRPKRRQDQAEQLAKRLMAGLEEKTFKEAIHESFPELQYFRSDEKEDKLRTQGALLAVYWIMANHYELFVRGQAESNRLKESSWKSLQDWKTKHVNLKSPAMVGAMLVFVEIMNLGKIKPFRLAFAPEYDEPTEALRSILQKFPLVIPSFSNLDPEMRQMIMAALKADFNFGQFLQAENLPASLNAIKQMLGEEGSSGNILGFFLFKIFAAMCGILGGTSLEGSLFMNDKNYLNFKVGLDVLGYLTSETAEQVYDRFLAQRALEQGLSFSAYNPDARARVRLACLARAFDRESGRAMSDAFEQLDPSMQKRLMDFVNADGITEKPGFLLYKSPQFIDAAKSNTKIGLTLALKVLLNVYEAAAAEYKDSDKVQHGVRKSEEPVVSIFVDEMLDFVKTADAETFSFTKFEICRAAGYKSDSQGSVHISPWQLVTDQKLIDSYAEQGRNLSKDIMRSGLREPGFVRKLPTVFPEMKFMAAGNGSDEVVKAIWKETICGALVVYWTVSDQSDAFSRGQQSETKISEQSWSKLQNMMAEAGINTEPVLNAVLVIIFTKLLGKIPKLRQQLAPQAEGEKQVLAHVLDTCPKVLPSYCRLDEPHRALVRECLTRDFNFSQFLCAELLPASITTVKEMVTLPCQDNTKCLSIFLYCLFVELAASMGPKNLDGSLYMTEAKWLEFESGWEAMNHLAEESEQDIYDRIMYKKAENLGLPFIKSKPESRAVVRLALLCRVMEPGQGRKVQAAFESLAAEDQKNLSKYLTMDGLTQKPAFILDHSSTFLENALKNGEVGLDAALKILLNVYQCAEKEFKNSTRAMVTVRLERLASFAKDFGGSVTFQDLPFDLHRKKEYEAIVVPKMWIPVTNQSILNELAEKGKLLAKELLAGQISERPFNVRMLRAFPELSYFNTNAEDKRLQTQCAMLAVFWLLMGQHEAFIRAQSEEERLSQQSWAWIQEWMRETVKLRNEEAVDAILTFMAIHALGKVKDFQEELAPEFDATRHDLALAHILRTKPEVVPSFMRLQQKYKSLIIDSLSVDFQFSQFLQAENVPANLVVVKEKLAPHGDEGFAFFCFRIFVQMCGKQGAKSLQGSLFMTEYQFQRFRPGLDALQKLKTNEAATAYNAFLLLQGSKALSRFASSEHQALARLLCLGSATDHASGDSLREAFDALPSAERAQLARWLVADGIQHKPGYVLCNAPDLLLRAQANPCVGLTNALRMMVRVQERCDVSASMRFNIVKVYVHLTELASWAQDCSVAGDFENARLEVRSEDLGDTRVFTVEVVRPTRTDRSLSARGGASCCCGCCAPCMRCLTMLILLLVLAAVVGAALCLRMRPVLAEPYLEQTGLHKKKALAALGGVAMVAFALLALLCGAACGERRCGDCGCLCCTSGACSNCGSCSSCCSCRPSNALWACSPQAGTLACGYRYSRLESDII